MNKSLKNIYREHHRENRKTGFSILEKDRGFLLRKLVGENKKVLDIGCRDGALTKYFIKSNYVLGIDIDDNALNKIKDDLNIETLNIDLNSDWQELGEKKFDVIVAGEIVEHLYNPDKVFRKINNRLEDRGILVGSVPNAFSLKNRVRLFLGEKKNTSQGDPTHINHFSRKELKKMLLEHFSEVEIVPLGRFAFLDRFFPGLFSFILFFYCQK